MGLFSKKKPQPPAPAKAPVDNRAPDAAQTAIIDSDGFFKSQESKSIKGLRGIKQSVIDERMAKMEQELAERPPQADYHEYDKNPVRERELERANQKFESVCEQVSEKEKGTKYKVIQEAITADVEEKVQELSDTYDYLTDESYNRNTAEFTEVIDDEQQRSSNEQEMAFVEKIESRPSSMPSLTELQMDLMADFVRGDIRAKPTDLPDDIPAMSADVLDKMTAQFEEKYGGEGGEQPEASTESSPNGDEQEELERLRKMFGYTE